MSIILSKILLRIILICKQSRTHLESRLARLVQYYQCQKAEHRKGFMIFLEVLTMTLTICADNFSYSLVEMKAGNSWRVFPHKQS